MFQYLIFGNHSKGMITLFLFFIVLLGCAKKITTNYLIENLSFENARNKLTGQEGTVIFKVSSYGFSVDEAQQRCLLDAMQAILFKGIPNSNSVYPLLNNYSILNEKKEFFTSFFGVSDLTNFCNKKCKERYGNISAKYRSFVEFASDGTIMNRVKVGNELRITMAVSVKFIELKKYLIENNIISSNNFEK